MSGFHSNASPHLHLSHPTLRFRNSAVAQPPQTFCDQGHCSASGPSAGTLACETVMLPELCGRASVRGPGGTTASASRVLGAVPSDICPCWESKKVSGSLPLCITPGGVTR